MGAPSAPKLSMIGAPLSLSAAASARGRVASLAALAPGQQGKRSRVLSVKQLSIAGCHSLQRGHDGDDDCSVSDANASAHC